DAYGFERPRGSGGAQMVADQAGSGELARFPSASPKRGQHAAVETGRSHETADKHIIHTSGGAGRSRTPSDTVLRQASLYPPRSRRSRRKALARLAGVALAPARRKPSTED